MRRPVSLAAAHAYVQSWLGQPSGEAVGPGEQHWPILCRLHEATGAVLTTRLLHAMRADGIRRGIVTLCIGGGQGIALALEALA